jgi:hypothetical protein
MLGMSFPGGYMEGFQQLLKLNIIPVTGAEQRENVTVK